MNYYVSDGYFATQGVRILKGVDSSRPIRPMRRWWLS